MVLRPSVLCPVDLSESSRAALRYAGAVAAHFGARLTLLAVVDPVLNEAAELTGSHVDVQAGTRREVERFFAETFADRPHGIADVRIDVAVGKPAQEILRVSHEKGCDLIAMSSHGSTGFRRMFFGSTTERVLRETRVPVLVTPGEDAGPRQLEDVPRLVRRILVPVDLSAATSHQLRLAQGLAEAIGVPLLLLHVVEPVRPMFAAAPGMPNVQTERRFRAEGELERAIDQLPARVSAEALVTYGEPAEEIAKVAQDREAGLIVMGLHSSPVLGPRMGSVTYRVLCLTHRLVLALPPAAVAAGSAGLQAQYAAADRQP